MPRDFLTYDQRAIAEPFPVVERLLRTKRDDVCPLAVSECFDLEDGDESRFREALAVIRRDFETVVAGLASSLGEPAFSGNDKDKGFPVWAALGYQVAYWPSAGRIIYLHVTHIGTVAPVELVLGVVTGPPPDWVAGT